VDCALGDPNNVNAHHHGPAKLLPLVTAGWGPYCADERAARGLLLRGGDELDHDAAMARELVSSTVGGGAQGLIIRKLLVGGEVNVDFLGAGLFMRARLYAGVMF